MPPAPTIITPCSVAAAKAIAGAAAGVEKEEAGVGAETEAAVAAVAPGPFEPLLVFAIGTSPAIPPTTFPNSLAAAALQPPLPASAAEVREKTMGPQLSTGLLPLSANFNTSA